MVSILASLTPAIHGMLLNLLQPASWGWGQAVGEKLSLVAFPDFHGINIPICADLKLLDDIIERGVGKMSHLALAQHCQQS